MALMARVRSFAWALCVAAFCLLAVASLTAAASASASTKRSAVSSAASASASSSSSSSSSSSELAAAPAVQLPSTALPSLPSTATKPAKQQQAKKRSTGGANKNTKKKPLKLPSTATAAQAAPAVPNFQTDELTESEKIQAVHSMVLELRRQLIRLQAAGGQVSGNTANAAAALAAAKHEAEDLRIQLDELKKRRALLQPGTFDQTKKLMTAAKVEAVESRRKAELAHVRLELQKQKILLHAAKEHDAKLVASQRKMDEEDAKRHSKLLQSLTQKTQLQMALLERKHKDRAARHHQSEIKQKRRDHLKHALERERKSDEHQRKMTAKEAHHKHTVEQIKLDQENQVQQVQAQTEAENKAASRMEIERQQRLTKKLEAKGKKESQHKQDEYKIKLQRKDERKAKSNLDSQERYLKTGEQAQKLQVTRQLQEKRIQQLKASSSEEKQKLEEKMQALQRESTLKVEEAKRAAEMHVKRFDQLQQEHLQRAQIDAEKTSKTAARVAANERTDKDAQRQFLATEREEADKDEEKSKLFAPSMAARNYEDTLAVTRPEMVTEPGEAPGPTPIK